MMQSLCASYDLKIVIKILHSIIKSMKFKSMKKRKRNKRNWKKLAITKPNYCIRKMIAIIKNQFDCSSIPNFHSTI